MTNKIRKSERVESAVSVPSPFHERFDIQLRIDEARGRFLNRVHNHIFDNFFNDPAMISDDTKRGLVLGNVADVMGEEFDWDNDFDDYVEGDFYRCLQVLEASYDALRGVRQKEELTQLIDLVLKESEVDLGVEWKDGKFIRTGAKLLDQKLVNEPLHWLSDRKYKNVYVPFAKGLSHFLEAEKRPELLSDVIIDMHEALEALAKIVTGRPKKDLSANAGLFIKKINASQHYKSILKEYIFYANEFRHALEEGKERPKLSVSEVESFIYLTGIFIRLAIGRI